MAAWLQGRRAAGPQGMCENDVRLGNKNKGYFKLLQIRWLKEEHRAYGNMNTALNIPWKCKTFPRTPTEDIGIFQSHDGKS